MAECIFCRIIAGEIKAHVVKRTDRVVAFRDVNPQAPVHILVVPTKHIDRLSAASGADGALLSELMTCATDIANSENLTESGYRVVVNEGADGGQTVGHLHFHVLGGRPMAWPPG